MGNEFGAVEALWSQFEAVMARDQEDEKEEEAGKEDDEDDGEEEEEGDQVNDKAEEKAR